MEPLLETLLARCPFVTERTSTDYPAVDVPAGQLRALAEVVRHELGFDMLSDVCGMDWGEDASPRFGVIYHFYHSQKKEFLRVATLAPDNDQPVVPSLVEVWPAANWHEREAFDMVGVRFEGHPDLRRILMWDAYPYHPLRKDFPLAGIETELPAADVAAATKATLIAAPMMGGPFHARSRDHHHMSDAEPRAADESWTEENPKPGAKG